MPIDEPPTPYDTSDNEVIVLRVRIEATNGSDFDKDETVLDVAEKLTEMYDDENFIVVVSHRDKDQPGSPF